jgi:hypothetical protein
LQRILPGARPEIRIAVNGFAAAPTFDSVPVL